MRPKQTPESQIWHTEDEIRFLRDLGKGIHSDGVLMSREQLLQNYERSIKDRRWDNNIDLSLIKDYLEVCK